MFCRPFQQAPLLWLAFASLAAPLAAAELKATESAEPLYHATRWTAEDGLPQMRISGLAQTADGYLWAGTWFGLARFDGVRFVVFNSANTPEFKKESITALAVDRGDGALWIGTPAGLLRLKDRQFTRLAATNELSTAVISKLVPAAGGGVWAWTHEAVVLWQGRLSARVPLPLSPPEERHSAWETAEGRLVVATDRRCLEVGEDGTMSEWRLPAGAPPHQWMAGVQARNPARQVWLSTQRGLFRFAGGQWQELQTFTPRMGSCDHFLADRAGCVWAACAQAGLFRCVAPAAQPVPLGGGAEKSINCLL
jgi:ligand-binding sensor domain-containing protein